MRPTPIALAAIVLSVLASSAHARPTSLGNSFGYQGRLILSGSPVNDSADFQFSLFDADTLGAQVGSTQNVNNIDVIEGNFAVTLDFGVNAFIGDERWLEIAVRSPAGSGSFTPLTPRQKIESTPYALFSLQSALSGTYGSAVNFTNASNIFAGSGSGLTNLNSASLTGTIASSLLAGSYSNPLTFSNASNSFTGTHSGTGTLLTALNASNLTSGTVADARLSSNVALLAGAQVFSGAKTFSLAPAFSAAGAPFTVSSTTKVVSLNADLLDGLDSSAFPTLGSNQTWTGINTFTSPSNSFAGSGTGLTSLNAANISSGNLAVARMPTGGDWNISSDLSFDTTKFFIDSSSGFVGVGTASPTATFHVVEGTSGTGLILPGLRVLQNPTSPTVIAGHSANTVLGGIQGAAIGGGGNVDDYNWVTDHYGTVGGGAGNRAGDNNLGADNATHATVAGGYSSFASGAYSTVGGGWFNNASGDYATSGGGAASFATGDYSTVPGGYFNQAGGNYSFAAGSGAKVRNASEAANATGDEGTFAWADRSRIGDFTSTGNNQFLIRAVGGVGIGTNSPGAPLHVLEGDSVGVTPHANASLVLERDAAANYLQLLSNDTSEFGLMFGKPASGVSGGIYYNASGNNTLTFRTNGNSTKMVITDVGDVGIGDTSPNARLDVEQSSNTVALFNRTTNDGVVIGIQQDGTQEGTISIIGTTVSYNAFTGSHYGWIPHDQSIDRFTLVRLTGHNRRLHDDPDSEIIYGIAPTARANDPACLGAYLAPLDSAQPLGSENPHLVMAVGNGEMYVVQGATDNGDIQPGDYLISSDTPGCAMKDNPDRFPIGHIVARAAQPLDWSTLQPDSAGVKRAKISVLFGNFVRNSQTQNLVRERDLQIADLHSRLQSLELAMKNLTEKLDGGPR